MMKRSGVWLRAGLFALAGTGFAVPARGAEDDFASLVRQRGRDWQVTENERLLDRIGWAGTLVEARQLAAKHGRPLFVFTYNGSTTRARAIALQRC